LGRFGAPSAGHVGRGTGRTSRWRNSNNFSKRIIIFSTVGPFLDKQFITQKNNDEGTKPPPAAAPESDHSINRLTALRMIQAIRWMGLCIRTCAGQCWRGAAARRRGWTRDGCLLGTDEKRVRRRNKAEFSQPAAPALASAKLPVIGPERGPAR
jgi:hypothetical protein